MKGKEEVLSFSPLSSPFAFYFSTALLFFFVVVSARAASSRFLHRSRAAQLLFTADESLFSSLFF